MPRTIDLPGGSATLRDAEEISGAGRKLVRAAAIAASSAFAKLPTEVTEPPKGTESAEERAARAAAVEDAMKAVEFSLSEALALETLREVSAVVSVAAWTLPYPAPSMSNIGELPGDVYDALLTAVGAVPDGALDTDFSPTTDASSPTEGSSASAGPSSDAPPNPSTTTSSSGGGSTATASSTPGSPMPSTSRSLP
ncbi:MAG TPA: hypothetical protein VF288_10855 [Mycobacteriales bacterium]